MATLMMVWSMEVTSRASTSTPRMRHRLGWLAWCVAEGLGGGTAVHDDSLGVVVWLVGVGWVVGVTGAGG